MPSLACCLLSDMHDKPVLKTVHYEGDILLLPNLKGLNMGQDALLKMRGKRVSPSPINDVFSY